METNSSADAFILNLQFYKDHGFSEHFVILDRRTLDVQFTKASFEGLMLKEKTAFYQCELQANVDTVDEGAVSIVDKYSARIPFVIISCNISSPEILSYTSCNH